MNYFVSAVLVCWCAWAMPLAAQSADEPASASAEVAPAPAAINAPEPVTKPLDGRVFGVLPNYRTGNLHDTYRPLTAKQKYYIGYKDSTDYPLFLLGGGLALIGQWADQHEEYGQGVQGFAKRWGASTADQLIGNILTESVLPSLLHQDPRYLRKGEGTKKARVGYAATRIFVAKNDNGRWAFNYSEVLGNALSAGIANAYYPGERSVSDNIQRLYSQLATDAISQVLKEFWPDIKRRMHRKSAAQSYLDPPKN